MTRSTTGSSPNEAIVRRIPILAAQQLEDAVFVNSLFDLQELPVLPFAVNQGGGNLSGSIHDVLGLLLLLGAGRKEVHGAKVSGHQKLVVAKLGDQSASLRPRIRRGRTELARSPRHRRVPVSERQTSAWGRPGLAPLKCSGSATALSFPSKLRRAISRCMGPTITKFLAR